MILTALVELAHYEGLTENPDFQPMPVRWRVTFGPGGTFLGKTDTARKPGSGKGKPISASLMVPKRSGRTSGVEAEFLVDKPSYVFGWVHPDALAKAAKEGKPEAKVRQGAAKQFAAYLAEVRAAVEATGDEGLVAWLALLDAGGPPEAELLGWTEGDLIAPCYYPDEGVTLPQRPTVVTYWSARRAGPGRDPAEASTSLPTCLVTGLPAAPVRLHPSIKGVPPVSDTKGGVPFTSVNATAFESYGLQGVGGATVSQAAADAYQAALNRLLSDGYPDPKHQGQTLGVRNVRLSDDTAVVFWAKDSGPADFFAEAVTRGEPDHVTALYGGPWKGSQVALASVEPFYALTLSGAIGRGTVRGWHETTLGAALANLRDYFDDLHIARPAADEARPQPLHLLLRQTAAQGKLENVPAALAGGVFLAILTGRPFARAVLEALVRRVRAERTIYPDRAAFLKACLCRVRRRELAETGETEIPRVNAMLDEACDDTAYRLGRLFALLEKLQEDAVSAKASIRDRYYGAASATPVVVFPQLLRKVPHHVAKLAGSGKYLDIRIQEVCSGLKPPTPFPPTLSLEQQGLFAVGYYHQRQALFTKRDKTTDTAAPTATPTEEV